MFHSHTHTSHKWITGTHTRMLASVSFTTSKSITTAHFSDKTNLWVRSGKWKDGWRDGNVKTS